MRLSEQELQKYRNLKLTDDEVFALAKEFGIKYIPKKGVPADRLRVAGFSSLQCRNLEIIGNHPHCDMPGAEGGGKKSAAVRRITTAECKACANPNLKQNAYLKGAVVYALLRALSAYDSNQEREAAIKKLEQKYHSR